MLIVAAVGWPLLAGCGSATTTTRTITTQATGTTQASSTASSTTSTTSTPTGSVYFQGAVGGPAQRPRSLQLTADGTLTVTGVQWASWGAATATGTGNASYHGCTPNCAAAPVSTALVSVRLSGIRACTGRNYYAGLTLTLGSGKLLDESFVQRSWSPC